MRGPLADAVLLLGEKDPPPQHAVVPAGAKLAPWSALGPDYRRLQIAVTAFTPGNSTDAFLLLRRSDTGVLAALLLPGACEDAPGLLATGGAEA